MRVPMPSAELDFDAAAHVVDVALHHVHADTAAGDIGDHFGGGEAGRENQLPDVLVGHVVRYRDAFFAALARILSRFRPAPSSLTSMTMLPP